LIASTRRELLISAAALALVPGRTGSESAAPPTLERELARVAGRSADDLAADERFWTAVREAFEHTPGQANLVTVVRGVAPRSVRESIAVESDAADLQRRAVHHARRDGSSRRSDRGDQLERCPAAQVIANASEAT
jgi:hypothetical protein